MLLRNKETGKLVEVMSGTRYPKTAYEVVPKDEKKVVTEKTADKTASNTTAGAAKKSTAKRKSPAKPSTAAKKSSGKPNTKPAANASSASEESTDKPKAQ